MEIRMLYYISSCEAWNAAPRNEHEIMIIIGDARQHGGVRQGIFSRKPRARMRAHRFW
jgi:hypothetical protein